ncbi:MAG: conjugal transfer protein TraG [Nitrospirales bacterium]|nr:MAG: conjugal transfer protein TraG [Nitrospirales bacterium]
MTSWERLARINQEGFLRPLYKDMTVLGHGADLQHVQSEGLIGFPDRERSGHLGCLGTTRIGKTRLMEWVIEQDMRKGYSVVVVDPKGDHELFSKVIQVAAECGRLEEVMLLTPIFPDQSLMIDPLANYYMEDELVSHITSSIKPKDEYYLNVATEVAQFVVAGLCRLGRVSGGSQSLTFQDIKNRIGFEDLRQLRDALEALGDAEELCHGIDQMVQNPGLAEFYGKVSSSLRTTLSALTFGSTGHIIGKASSNVFIDRLERGQSVLLYCNTGSLLTRRTANIIGKVFVSMVQSLVGRIFASGRKLSPPLCLHIDEGHNVLYPGMEELMNKGGGADVWLSLYTQSLAQVEDAVGPTAARSIVDNINSWVYFLVNHPMTADHIEQTSPLIQRHEPVISLGGGITMRTLDVPLVRAHKVSSLPKQWFYFRSQGRFAKGWTMKVVPAKVSVKFPQIRPMDSAAPAVGE